MSNAAAYHLKISNAGLEKIRPAILEIRSQSLVFRTASGLAKYLEKRVGISAGRLLRNDAYRKEIDSYFNRTGHVEVNEAKLPPAVRSLLRDYRLQISNLNAGLVRLSSAREFSHSASDPVGNARKLDKSDVSDVYRDAFRGTAKILLACIERYDSVGLEIDFASSTVRDRSAGPYDEVLGSSSDAKWFVRWVQEKRHLKSKA